MGFNSVKQICRETGPFILLIQSSSSEFEFQYIAHGVYWLWLLSSHAWQRLPRIYCFNTEFGHFLFLRAPQVLSSSDDHFYSATDQFFSGLGEWLVKQVDDRLGKVRICIFLQTVQRSWKLGMKYLKEKQYVMVAPRASANFLLVGIIILFLAIK